MDLLAWLFPKKCVGCGKIGKYVCANCTNRFVLKKKQICPQCGGGSMWGKTHARCERKWSMDGLIVVFEYWGVVRKLIGKVKYRLVRSMVDELVEAVISLGEFEVLANGEWVVVPVPLHINRLRIRGFNQSEYLAKKLAAELNLYYGDLLVRTRHTRPQVGMDLKGRLANVKGAFGLSPKVGKREIESKQVLLVDDVWTSGATMRECAKVLKRLGASNVWGLAIAS